VTFFCLGDLMVDVVARLFGPLAEGSDSPGVISYVGGGSAANTAAWLTRVGESTTFIGAIGDDAAGQSQLESLHRLGVDVRFRVDRTRPTGTCLVLVAPSGERTMVPDPGANLSLLEHDVPVDEFRAGDHLHVSGYALLRDSRDAALHAMTRAASADMTVSVGAASAAPLELLGASDFLRMVPEGALLFANEREAAVLAGGPGTATDLAAHLAAGGRESVVTAGSGEAAWSNGEASTSLAAESLDRPELDTTGAGDAFAAGFLAARARAAAPEVCLRDGHALAAAACRTTGGRPEPR
jgi:sugar/nucleoside kinase (ribokinase family)